MQKNAVANCVISGRPTTPTFSWPGGTARPHRRMGEWPLANRNWDACRKNEHTFSSKLLISEHFIFQLMHTNYRIPRLLKELKL